MVIAMEQLAYNILFFRNKNNWTQAHLGALLNVSRSVVSKWESGHTVPDAKAILQLSKAFHISSDHLLGNPQHHEDILKDYRELYNLNNTFSKSSDEALELIHYVLMHPDLGKTILRMRDLPMRKQLYLHQLFDDIISYDHI